MDFQYNYRKKIQVQAQNKINVNMCLLRFEMKTLGETLLVNFDFCLKYSLRFKEKPAVHHNPQSSKCPM